MYAIRDIPGKGKGLVATHKIAKGTRILSEKPLFQIRLLLGREEPMDDSATQSTLSRKVHALTPDAREEFLALQNAFPGSTDGEYGGRVRTNGFALDFMKAMITNGPVSYGSDGDSDGDSDSDLGVDEDEDEDDLNLAVFRDASRINHDCENNSHNSWNERIKRYTVHSLRDIEEGE